MITIPPVVIDAAVRLLSPFAPGLTAERILKALSSEDTTGQAVVRKEYTRKEAAARLGVVTRTIDRMIDAGKLDARRIGSKKILITRESVDALLDVKKYATAAGQL